MDQPHDNPKNKLQELMQKGKMPLPRYESRVAPSNDSNPNGIMWQARVVARDPAAPPNPWCGACATKKDAHMEAARSELERMGLKPPNYNNCHDDDDDDDRAKGVGCGACISLGMTYNVYVDYDHMQREWERLEEAIITGVHSDIMLRGYYSLGTAMKAKYQHPSVCSYQAETSNREIVDYMLARDVYRELDKRMENAQGVEEKMLHRFLICSRDSALHNIAHLCNRGLSTPVCYVLQSAKQIFDVVNSSPPIRS